MPPRAKPPRAEPPPPSAPPLPRRSPPLPPSPLLLLLTGLSLGVYHSLSHALLSSLHASLPSTFIHILLPTLSFLLTTLLPPFAALPPLLFLLLCHTSGLPLLHLAAAFQTAGGLARTNPHRAQVLLPVLLASTLCPSPRPAIHARLAALALRFLVTVAAAQLLLHSVAIREAWHRLAAARRSKQGRRRLPPVSPIPVWLQLPFAMVAVYLLASCAAPLGRAVVRLVHPRRLPPGFRILTQTRGPTGLVSVVQTPKYRMLTADVSVLGGRYTHQRYDPDSIFGQFHVHEAVRLSRRPGDGDGIVGGRDGRTLCIGLGVGIVADGLHRLGGEVTALELDPVVARYAQAFFGMSAPDVRVVDALDFLREAQGGDEKERYDYVVHDVFTGCGVPAALFSMDTFRSVRGVLKKHGVLAVNFVGGLDDPPTAMATAVVGLVYDRLQAVFGNVRMFSDGDDTRTHNIVFFASGFAEGVQFRHPVERDFLESRMRQSALEAFQKREVQRERVGEIVQDVEGSDWMLFMGQWDICQAHLELMKSIHQTDLWPALLAHETEHIGV